MTLPSTPGEQGGRPKRRTFTAEYKLRIVAEYDAAKASVRGGDPAPGGPVSLAHPGVAGRAGRRRVDRPGHPQESGG